jgi:hypothetical protein
MSSIHLQPLVQDIQPTLQSKVQGNNEQCEHMALDDDRDEEQGQDDKGEDAKEIQFSELTLEDMLYGYLPDKSCNPMEMEEDGHYSEEFQFNRTYEDVPPNTVNVTYPHYNGPGSC